MASENGAGAVGTPGGEEGAACAPDHAAHVGSDPARDPGAPGGTPGRGRQPAGAAAPSEPPQVPVTTLKLPQDSGARQSAIRSREPGR